MEFLVLGHFAVRDSERIPINIPFGKQRDVVGFLLLHRNKIVSTDRLIRLVWGDAPPKSARKNLQTYVWRSRCQLGADRLTRDTPGYVLRVAPGELDLDLFESQTAAARQLAAAGDLAGAITGLRHALRLWQGQPFAGTGLTHDEHPELIGLEEKHLSVLEYRTELELRVGRYAELVPELRMLVLRYPLRERFRAQLMLALYRSGRHVEALDAYRDAHAVLDHDFGLAPGILLRSIQQAILSGSDVLHSRLGLSEMFSLDHV